MHIMKALHKEEFHIRKMNEPAHKISALIATTSGEGSGESVYVCSLARAFAACIHNVWK